MPNSNNSRLNSLLSEPSSKIADFRGNRRGRRGFPRADRMATKAEMEEALTNALKNKPKTIIFPDYDTSQDFTLWLKGFAARVRLNNGFKLEEETKVQDEIVRSIAGKLKIGTALDAYDRLTPDEKKDYKLLVQKLTEEFIDPHEKRKFNECHDYNKRKKGQTLKDFMQVIIGDMDRYSDLPNEILVAVPGVGNAPATNSSIPNPEKEKQGVRRFRAGMRNSKGKKCKELMAHLRYNLVEDNQLTWKHAIKVASNWEIAYHDDASASEKEKEDSSDDDIQTVEVKTKSKATKSKCNAGVISALHDQVHENQMKIAKIETAQERLATSVNEMKVSTDTSLKEISAKLDANLALGSNMGNQQHQQFQRPQQQQQQQQQSNQSRPQPYTQPYNQQAYNQQRNQQQRGGFRGRPRQLTWSAQTQQQRQGNYGYDRKTPTAFPSAPAANLNQSTPKSTTTAAVVDVGEEEEQEQETLLGAEGGDEQKVSISLTDFYFLTNKAGLQIPEDDLVQAVDDVNFQ